MTKHIIPVCVNCEKEFHEAGAGIRHAARKYGLTGGEITFSHGFCLRHYEKVMIDYGYSQEDIKINLMNARNDANLPPDLEDRPDLVYLWSIGIFTEEQKQEYIKKLTQDNKFLTERFKTLAGIPLDSSD